MSDYKKTRAIIHGTSLTLPDWEQQLKFNLLFYDHVYVVDLKASIAAALAPNITMDHARELGARLSLLSDTLSEVVSLVEGTSFFDVIPRIRPLNPDGVDVSFPEFYMLLDAIIVFSEHHNDARALVARLPISPIVESLRANGYFTELPLRNSLFTGVQCIAAKYLSDIGADASYASDIFSRHYPTLKRNSVPETAKSSLYDLVIRNFPLPKSMTFDELLTFRNIPEIKQSLKAFRLLPNEISENSMRSDEVSDYIHGELTSLEKEYKGLGLPCIYESVKSSIIDHVGLAEAVIKFRFTDATQKVFEIIEKLTSPDRAPSHPNQDHPLYYLLETRKLEN